MLEIYDFTNIEEVSSSGVIIDRVSCPKEERNMIFG